MKRLRVDDTTTATIKEVTGSSPVATVTLYNQSTPVLTTFNTTTNTITNIKVVSEGMQSGLYPPAPVSYGAMPAAAVPHSGKSTPMQPLTVGSGGGAVGAGGGGGGGHSQLRTTGSSPPNASVQELQSQQQQQQSAPIQQSQLQSPGGNFQRLKVEDALSYLDLVKFKFGSKPQVYNDFLDIMKEFKSQSIDTPGVIQRVSNLFKGFPELIVGFNTFLPPGYKIEVQKSDQGYAFQVSVSMPSPTGNVQSDPQQQKMIMRGSGTINVSGNVPIQTMPPCQPLSLAQHVQPTVVTATPQPTQQQQQPPPPSSVPVVHHSSNYGSGGGGAVTPIYNNSLTLQTTQVAASQALQGHTDAPQNQQPVQFNHAINYVNKIKNRFQSEPEKYKRFLDILHIYQKEQRTMKESSGGGPGTGKHLTEQEVYSQVAKLFENQSDLLAEFGQFLPDATNNMNQQSITGRNDSSGGGGGGGGGGVGGPGGGGGGGISVGGGGGGVASVIGAAGGGGINSIGTISNNIIGNSANCGGTGNIISAVSGGGGSIGASVGSGGVVDHTSVVKKPPTKQPYNRDNMMDRHLTHKPSHISGHLKRSPTYPALLHRDGAPPPKKHKLSSCKDVTLAEAGKYGTLNDYAFFDKVRKALRTQEVYNNFLRCLILFNQEIISKSELIMIVTPFLGKFPELMRWFREFLGQNDVEPIPYNVTRSERPQGEQQVEIDLATAKRLGASYCVIPPAQEGLTCSGRTQLCKEVLNDQWVSFPTWSEDSTFVSSRKTQYEEYMYRCEDERFELDVVIETNASTIRVLEGVAKKLNRMNADEVSKFRLDDCLGGSSPTLHQRALKRIYGDKSNEIIEGLKRNPAVAVPVVLRRLKAKEEEWREAQKGFNKLWREQNEKYYLKSLDHQGINFKQTDVKALRSKSLFNEIETIFDERHEQNEEGAEPINGPHLIIPYKDRTILDDAANLLIHHVKRQTGIQKGEKRRIKHLLRQFLPELFFHPKQQLTDDERDDDDDKEDGDESPSSSPNSNNTKTKGGGESSPGKSPGRYDSSEIEVKPEPDLKDDEVKVPLHAQTNDPEEAYTLFMANNNWYIFLRLHAILCERLAKIYERAVALAAEEAKNRSSRKESTAIALRLKPKPQIEIEDYYVAFLDMVKNLLDNNMDANTYEDTLREMFGIHAYIAFTLDKVVSYAVRQLQHCVTERTAIACTDLFNKEQKRGATGGVCTTAHRRQHLEFSYQRAAEKAVQDENCFKIYIYKRDCRMTIELMDTDSEDSKKVDETKKWSNYKECYADCRNVDNKRHSPVYLNRNLRIYKKRMNSGSSSNNNNNNNNNNNSHKDKKNSTTNNNNNNNNTNESSDDQDNNKRQSESSNDSKKRRNSGGGGGGGGEDDDNSDKRYGILDEFERKLERPLPDRNQTEHPGYDVSDETQCKFNSQDSKIMYAVNKDSYLYKISAFYKARKSHPTITKRLSSRFRAWLKRWASENISDVQHKQCIDWLMGRGDGVVPNRTRVLTDNDLTRTPYIPYNRYRVERLNDDST